MELKNPLLSLLGQGLPLTTEMQSHTIGLPGMSTLQAMVKIIRKNDSDVADDNIIIIIEDVIRLILRRPAA